MAVYSLDEHSPEFPAPGDYWIAPGAHVIGRVVLGHEASVWFDAVVRGDNEPIAIGPRSNVQDGAVLHVDPGFPMTIGAECTVGHRAILHGCTVGEGTLIGMGATVLNGARIGEGCLVGANALVTEGKVFPPRSLIVGSPAKAVRELDDKAVEDLRRAAARYVANWKRYAQSLKPLGASGRG